MQMIELEQGRAMPRIGRALGRALRVIEPVRTPAVRLTGWTVVWGRGLACG